jgi:hypothetical protein
VYGIAKQFFDKKAAQCAALCYAVFVFPLTFVTVLANSHPAGLLAYGGIYLLVAKRFDSMNWVLKYALSSLLVTLGYVFSLHAVIVVAAVAVYFVVAILAKRTKRTLLRYGLGLVVFIGCFLAISTLLSHAVAWSGINSAGLGNAGPWGKFVFGTNVSSAGTYNEADVLLIQEKMESEGLTESEAHIAIIKEHLSGNPAKLLELERGKITHLWWHPGLAWSLGHLRSTYPRLYEFAEKADRAMFSCLLVAAVIGTLIVFRRKNENLASYIPPFIVAAAFIAYLATEVQSRYAYLPQIALAIVAAGGIQGIVSAVGRFLPERVCESEAPSGPEEPDPS